MDKLSPQHLHLLFDEPIYVLEDHGDHPIAETTTTDIHKSEKVAFEGNNEKGLAIFIEKNTLSEEDRNFLFKGLNALDLTEKDIALIVSNVFEDTNQNPPHVLRIVFFDAPENIDLYSVIKTNEIALLNCHSISEIQQSQDLKIKFWLGLKALLGKS